MKKHSYLAMAVLTCFCWGPAQTASAQKNGLTYPLDIVVGENGVFYVADLNQPGVWKSVAAGGPEGVAAGGPEGQDGALSLLFQASKRFGTPLNRVRCVALDQQGRLLAGDSATREVYRFDAKGLPQPLTEAKIIQIPMDMVVTPAGDILVSDLQLNRIWKVPPMGGKPTLFAKVNSPSGLFLDNNEQLWVVSRGPQPLFRISPEGKVETILKERIFEFPNDIVVDQQQNAYISDNYADAIWKMAPGEKPQKWVSGKPLQNPVGLAFKGKDLLVADSHAKAIFQVNPEGKVSPLKWKSSRRSKRQARGR